MLPTVESSRNERSLPRTSSREFSDKRPSTATRKAKYQTKQSRQQHKKNKHRSTRHNPNKHHLKKPEPKPRHYGKQQTTDATTLEFKQPRSLSFGDLDGREKEARQKHKPKKKKKKKKQKHRDRHKGPSSHTTTRASPGEESLAVDLAVVGMPTPTPTGLRTPGHRLMNACMETTTPNPDPSPETPGHRIMNECMETSTPNPDPTPETPGHRIMNECMEANTSKPKPRSSPTRPLSAIRERPSSPPTVISALAKKGQVRPQSAAPRSPVKSQVRPQSAAPKGLQVSTTDDSQTSSAEINSKAKYLSPTHKEQLYTKTLEPGDDSLTVVLLEDDASKGTKIAAKLTKAVSLLRERHRPRIIRFMRVQYVRNTDITEHIRRLGLPVDLTLMFYNSNTPRQPNARKLRAAFPDMKICLCGKDSHLSHMVEGNKRLPPSQWKLATKGCRNLPKDIADDFIVEPFRDIEFPLAGLLQLGYLSTSTHLKWAQRNLLRTPDSDTKVRVSSSSISDVQRDFRCRIRDGTVRTRQMAGHVPYVYQGDTRMYTKKNVRKRKKLFFNRDIGRAIRAFWRVLDLTKDSFGCIRVTDFLVMNIKIQKALMPGLRIKDAIPTSLKDWKNDCGGGFMTENEFFESFFEMTDLWCSTVDPDEYVLFLVSLLVTITVTHDSVDGCRRWRSDQDITHINFEQATKQLRETFIMSAATLPASDPAANYVEGAEIEAEGAGGQWMWAKIKACHDDGTFNVFIFDDHTGGGQEWTNVRPVHLRPRVQAVRPTGIATRPSPDIPRWGGDDGDAFLAAVDVYAEKYASEHGSATARERLQKKLLGKWTVGSNSGDDSDDSCDPFPNGGGMGGKQASGDTDKPVGAGSRGEARLKRGQTRGKRDRTTRQQKRTQNSSRNRNQARSNKPGNQKKSSLAGQKTSPSRTSKNSRTNVLPKNKVVSTKQSSRGQRGQQSDGRIRKRPAIYLPKSLGANSTKDGALKDPGARGEAGGETIPGLNTSDEDARNIPGAKVGHRRLRRTKSVPSVPLLKQTPKLKRTKSAPGNLRDEDVTNIPGEISEFSSSDSDAKDTSNSLCVGGQRLTRHKSVPKLCGENKSSHRLAHRRKLEQAKTKINVYHGITNSKILRKSTLTVSKFSVSSQNEFKPLPIKVDRMKRWKKKILAKARRRKKDKKPDLCEIKKGPVDKPGKPRQMELDFAFQKFF